MRYLLDTHIFIWANSTPSKLDKATWKILENPKNQLFVSSVSFWECAYLAEKSNREMGIQEQSLKQFLEAAVENLKLDVLDIKPSHAQRHYEIQPVEGHSDLFDRMILAQAASENLLLLSYDRQFPKYPMVRLAL